MYLHDIVKCDFHIVLQGQIKAQRFQLEVLFESFIEKTVSFNACHILI